MKNKLFLSLFVYYILFTGIAFCMEDEGYKKYVEKIKQERQSEKFLFDDAVLRLINNDPTLTKLDLEAKENASDLKLICWALLNNTHLTELNMPGNNTRDEGEKALANMLKVNKSILRLDLSNNHICGEWLAEGIKVNTSVLDINLRLNGKIKNSEELSIIESINQNRVNKGLFKITKN